MFLAGLAAAVAYTLLAVGCVGSFRLAPSAPAGQATPGLSVLKPICGLGEGLQENLLSLFEQDYPDFEILFGFQDPGDPAVALVEEMRARHPQVTTYLVPVPQAAGPNRKASVLAAMEALAYHEVLVVSDQDMRFPPGYLRSVAAPFADPQVGLVTCLYRCADASGPGDVLEALSVNVDFIPSALVARRLEGLTFALGATMAPRRAALQAIGGFAALERYLADDYQLGNRIHRGGWRLALADCVVDDVLPATSLAAFFTHQLRWARTYRVCRPAGYFGSVLMNGTPFALGLWLLWPGHAAAGALFLGWMALRAASAGLNQTLLLEGLGNPDRTRSPSRRGGFRHMRWLAWLPLKDLASLALWCLALTGDSVRWGDRTFHLHSDGTLEAA